MILSIGVQRCRYFVHSFALILAIAAAASAQGTRLWTQQHLDDWEHGTSQAVSIGSDGWLRPADGLNTLWTSPAAAAWAVAADSQGNRYLATAQPATVTRISATGKATILFSTKELSVQSLLLSRTGQLYAATLPSGRIYRLDPAANTSLDDKSAPLVFDPAAQTPAPRDGASKVERPVWALTEDATGRLYAALGNPAAIYRIDGSKSELFFQSDEAHLRSMTWDAAGNLIAGTDGTGLVYRIGPDAKSYVLFEAPRREITSVAVAADGTILVAAIGDKSHNPLPRLAVTPGSVNYVSLSDPMTGANASTSVPDGSEIWAVRPNQAPRRIWTGKEEVVYQLIADHNSAIALTGNRGRILRIELDGHLQDLAHLDAEQGLAATRDPRSGQLLIATGNAGRLVTIDPSAREHLYASDILDAGALARFGRIELAPGSHGVQLFTRTGNVSQPARGRAEHADWGWSPWQPVTDGRVQSPAGRYLQWKAQLAPDAALGAVSVNYLPVNAAPVVDDLIVVPGARLQPATPPSGPATVSIAFGPPAAATSDAAQALTANKDRTAVTARWNAHDDNGDELSFAVYLRGDNESVWRLVKDNLTDRALSFDASMLPDGGYQLKVVASDLPAHAPADALIAERISERFELDTTAPVVTLATPHAGLVEATAVDAMSVLAHAEYAIDLGPWQTVEPVGLLSDSPSERYQIHLPQLPAGEHLVTVRVTDRHDNTGLAKLVVR